MHNNETLMVLEFNYIKTIGRSNNIYIAQYEQKKSLSGQKVNKNCNVSETKLQR